MANKDVFDEKMEALADAINAKAGTSGALTLDGMKTAVDAIELGSEVIANPTLEGGEDDLTSIEIDGTKYAVPKGAYIATMRTASYVSAESVTFMQNNYMTTPCYVPYGNYLFRMARLVGTTLISAPLNASNAVSDFNLTQIFVENNGSINGQNQLVPRVTANPSTTGSDDLTKLAVNGTTYNIPTGSSVEANPTLAGTEADLVGIEVDGTKFKVGGKLYMHNICATSSSQSGYITFTIINRDSTIFTAGTIDEWLTENGMTSKSTGLNCSGIFDDNGLKFPIKIYSRGDNTALILLVNVGTSSGWTLSSLTITDTVIEL